MKFSRFLIALMMCAPLFASATELLVPGPGSAWVYRMHYATTDSTSGQHHVFVKEMRYGRPVFSADLGGREFSIFEESDYVVLLEKDCEEKHETAPPQFAPNTCGWVPCTIEVGETIERKLVVIAKLTECKKAAGVARFKGLEVGISHVLGQSIASVKSEAYIKIPGMGGVTWYPHVSRGKGEVFAESSGGREARYDKVLVVEVPYVFVADSQQKIVAPSSPVADARVHYVVRQNVTVWVAFGDSLTEGVGADKGESYPSVLEGLLANRRVQIVNAGIAGEKVAGLMERVEEILVLKPKMVLLCAGANDILGGTPPSILEEQLVALVLRIKASGAEVVLLGIEMDVHSPYAGVFTRAALRSAVQLVPNVLKGVYGIPDMTSADGLHPNGKGYSAMAKNVLEALEAQKD